MNGPRWGGGKDKRIIRHLTERAEKAERMLGEVHRLAHDRPTKDILPIIHQITEPWHVHHPIPPDPAPGAPAVRWVCECGWKGEERHTRMKGAARFHWVDEGPGVPLGGHYCGPVREVKAERREQGE